MPHDEPIVAVTSSDGHRFELIEIGADTASDLVLLLPGMGIPARHYIDFARALADGGARVLIHEWRGIGSSSLRAARHCNWGYRELLQFDLAAAVAAAQDASASARLWLAGHSLGGQLACLAAARARPPIAGVAVIASGMPYYAVFPARMRRKLRVVFRAFPALAALVGHFPGRRLGWGGNEARGVISDWARTGRSGHYALPSLDFDAEAALRRLDCPLLVLRMADDSWVPQTSVDWLMRKMPDCSIDQRSIGHEQQGRAADHFNWLQVPEASAAEVHGWMRASAQASSRGNRKDRRRCADSSFGRLVVWSFCRGPCAVDARAGLTGLNTIRRSRPARCRRDPRP
ncbi:MAG: alpha/beta hydrolase [Gammaproteobacteria bacterium HGW-Gammaproteobacteria-8]|nr:MAG: alpha/beta hydrolase [Gammaproteobacteria bacterium HGW-Gammaproteobacteria-8]